MDVFLKRYSIILTIGDDFMKHLKNGEEIAVTAYKHDGSMHRLWRKMTVIHHDDNKIVLANEFAKVIESDGKNWFTPEPAVSVFFKDRFYNIIAMLKKDGIYFYCNLSSPAIIDKEGLKYIDYDLDLRILPDFTYQVLDENEYQLNIEKYGYSKDLQDVLNDTLEKLIKRVENREKPFNHKYIEELYLEYVVNRK